MCGIFGVALKEGSGWTSGPVRSVVDALFKLSESRGKEAAGVAVQSDGAIRVYKEAVRATTMIRRRPYRDLFGGANNGSSRAARSAASRPMTIIGHSRMVTNGATDTHTNNQPLISHGMVTVHNGIIVNVDDLWHVHHDVERRCDVDSEIIPALIAGYYDREASLLTAVRRTFQDIRGMASVAIMFDFLDGLLLASNNGSLYFAHQPTGGVLFFASEQYIMTRLQDRFPQLAAYTVQQVPPGRAILLRTDDFTLHPFTLADSALPSAEPAPRVKTYPITDISQPDPPALATTPARSPVVPPQAMQLVRLLEDNSLAVSRLQRCSRCVFPETFPFIEFDEAGVCNYCRNHRRLAYKGDASLAEAVDKYRSTTGKPDCIVSISGGRDSTYSLHYVKRVLKMNPMAFTYDWGMVTDLARRNISRICETLGVEHILVSADIPTKRAYIRKNVLAWLRRPALGTIPLFMAGDKQYFYHANKTMKQYNIGLLVMAENQLERTHFKHGFSGIRHSDADKPAYHLTTKDKLKIALYYGKEYLLNPAYINTSLVDTLGAYLSFYFIPHRYLQLFNYLPWNEHTIISTLRDTYDWELAEDTASTWRIGDGTAAFYNYIYYTVAGFTENDSLRSNQIREGLIDRDVALQLVNDANRPRFESIKWYCDTIGVDFVDTISTINRIPKLYPAHYRLSGDRP